VSDINTLYVLLTYWWPRILSKIVFQWVAPFLNAGYSRPLEKDGDQSTFFLSMHFDDTQIDLWSLPDYMLAASVSQEVEKNFYSRCEPEDRPRSFQARAKDPSTRSTLTKEGDVDSQQTRLETTPLEDPKYDSSLLLALNRTFFARIWMGGLLKLSLGLSPLTILN
jgi:ATP-binding cassette subfamily C (CFTR/MRP) protein 1